MERNVLDRGEHGLVFTKVTVDIDMEVSDVERARAVLDEPKQHCLICDMLKVSVEIGATIHTPLRKAG